MDYLLSGISFTALSVVAVFAFAYYRRWQETVQDYESALGQLRSLREFTEASAHYGAGNFSPDGLVIVNSEGTIVQSNLQMQTLFGCPAEELTGSPLSSLFPNNRLINLEDLRPGACQTKRMIMAMDGIGDRFQGLRKDGSYFSAEIAILRGEFELNDLFAVSIRDISDRIQVAMGFLETTLDAIFAYDIESMVFIYANKGAEKQFGYSRDELLTMRPQEIIDDQSWSTFKEQYDMQCAAIVIRRDEP